MLGFLSKAFQQVTKLFQKLIMDGCKISALLAQNVNHQCGLFHALKPTNVLLRFVEPTMREAANDARCHSGRSKEGFERRSSARPVATENQNFTLE